MPGSSNFLQFDPALINMASDTDYSNSTYRLNGVAPGIAKSDIHNKLFYQTSTFTAALSQMLANLGYVVSDANFTGLINTLAVLAPIDGWMPATETWTYVNATTFTATGDQTVYHQKGDKIKLTQSSTIKYFYLLSVTYDGTSTSTFTVNGGSDYTLTNTPIINNYYSHQENPVGFPGWFNYVPTITYNGGSSPTSNTINIAKFKLTASEARVIITSTVVRGSSTASYVVYTTPVYNPNTTYISLDANSNLINSELLPYTCFLNGQSVSVFLNGAMARDGVVTLQGFYPY